jgi:hypothetical protein
MDDWLLQAQAWWDAHHVDQPAWELTTWQEQKVRHIQLHVAKALGKVVTAYGAGADTASSIAPLVRVRDEALPDVAISRSQLRHLFPDVETPLSLPSNLSSLRMVVLLHLLEAKPQFLREAPDVGFFKQRLVIAWN